MGKQSNSVSDNGEDFTRQMHSNIKTSTSKKKKKCLHISVKVRDKHVTRRGSYNMEASVRHEPESARRYQKQNG